MTVSAVFNCLSQWIWKLLALWESREKCWESGSYCPSRFEGKVASCLKESVGLGTEGSHRRENRLALDRVRLWKASDAAIKVICKGKSSNQRVFSGMWIKWRCSREWGRGDNPDWPQTHSANHLKRLESLEKGGGVQRQGKCEGNLSICCLTRRNHLKFLVHRFVFRSFVFVRPFVRSFVFLFVFQENFFLQELHF